MGVKLYYGVAPASLGPFTVQPQSVWLEGNARKIKGEDFIDCAIEGSGAMAPVARAVVEAIAEQSMNFDFNMADIWPEGLAVDPKLEAAVTDSIPDPAPITPDPEIKQSPADNDVLGNMLANVVSDALNQRDQRPIPVALSIASKMREITHDYGPREVLNHPGFNAVVNLFDENANDGFVIAGYDIREVVPKAAPYVVAWSIQGSGVAHDAHAMWVQFIEAVTTGLGARSRMTYLASPDFSPMIDSLNNMLNKDLPYIESMYPNFATARARRRGTRELTGRAFADMGIAKAILVELTQYASELEGLAPHIEKVQGGLYPEWFPLRNIGSYIAEGCADVCPFRHMRNTPANTDAELDPICSWFVENLKTVDATLRVIYVSNTMGVINNIPPFGIRTGYDAAEDKRWPAIASLYRFLRNGVWEKYVPAAVQGDCQAELDQLVAKAAPVQNVEAYGYQAALSHAHAIRKFCTQALEKGSSYAQPATTYIAQGMPGVIPISAAGFESFSKFLEYISKQLVMFAAVRILEYRKSGISKIENGPRDLAKHDTSDALRAALALTEQWRPIDMTAEQFRESRGMGIPAFLHRQFNDWFKTADVDNFVDGIVKRALGTVDDVKQEVPTPEKQWDDIVADVRDAHLVSRPPNLERLNMQHIEQSERATQMLRKTGDAWAHALTESIDLRFTGAAFADLCYLSPALNADQYMDAAIYVARLFDKASAPLEHDLERSARSGLSTVFDSLCNIRPIGMSRSTWFNAQAPAQMRKAIKDIRDTLDSPELLARFVDECFRNESDLQPKTEAFISALQLVAMRPQAIEAPTLVDLFDLNQVMLEHRAIFREHAVDAAKEAYELWWNNYMQLSDLAKLLPITYSTSWDQVRALIMRSVQRAGIREEVEIRAFIDNMCANLHRMGNHMRPLFMNPIRWSEVAPQPFQNALDNLSNVVDNTAYGIRFTNELVVACLPKTGSGSEIDAEILEIIKSLQSVTSARIRMRRAASMVDSIRVKAQQDPLVYMKWEGAFNEFKHADILGLKPSATYDTLMSFVIAFVDEEMVGHKATLLVVCEKFVDALQAVASACVQMRPLDMSPKSWNDLKMRPNVAPSIRGATAQLTAFIMQPEQVAAFALEKWRFQIIDAGAHEDTTSQSVPRPSAGKISYNSFDEGSADAKYRSVVPSTPQTGVDNSEVFSGSASYQANKIFEATLRQGFNGGRVYRLPDNVLEDLAKYSKCLGLKRALPAGNFVVVGCDSPGSTCIATLSSGGRMVSIVYINMAEIAQHLGGANTQSILHALTHEFAHYFHKGLKGTALLEWKKATGGRKLHPAQGRDAYAFDTEQFAILAETMVCGNSARGLYNCNGINVVERFFVNNFITAEDRQKLA